MVPQAIYPKNINGTTSRGLITRALILGGLITRALGWRKVHITRYVLVLFVFCYRFIDSERCFNVCVFVCVGVI